MNEANNEYVIVGKIGKTYGIHGWLKVFSYTEVITDLLDFDTWYLEEGNGWKAISEKAGREHSGAVVIKLPGYDTPEQARILTGKKIAVTRKQLPKLGKDEYYWADLDGLTVINQHGETLGKITQILATGANDVLVIKDEQGKEQAIPYLLSSVITKIDLKNQVMYVDWELL